MEIANGAPLILILLVLLILLYRAAIETQAN